MDYLLDTNIVVIYSRDNEIARKIEAKYQIFNTDNRLAISTISLGEINAISKKLQLGEKRKNKIDEIVEHLNEFGIDVREVIERYGDIDAYSQGKLQSIRGEFTARNMGKNDIWIAATASVFGLTLITTDKDFDHLNSRFLSVKYIPLKDFE